MVGGTLNFSLRFMFKQKFWTGRSISMQKNIPQFHMMIMTKKGGLKIVVLMIWPQPFNIRNQRDLIGNY